MRVLALLVVAALCSACSDDERVPTETESTATRGGPRFIAPARSGTILFSSNRHAPASSGADAAIPDLELFVVNPDGTGLTQITDSRGALLMPRWSPDGDTVAFIWTEDGTDSQVWLADHDGTDLSMLRDTEGLSFGLSWSPDGEQLTYVDNGSIHVLEIASGSDRVLVEGSWPAWSIVDGVLVVVYTAGEFVGEGSRTELRVIDPDGGHDRAIRLGPSESPADLTNASEASAEPGTSRIAFVASPNGYRGKPTEWNEQIYAVELLAGDPVRTTPPVLVSPSSTNDHWPPAWSPRSSTGDDACVVWTSDDAQSDPPTGGLVLAWIDGAADAIFELTAPGIAYDWFPDWHPTAACPTNSTG